MDKGKNEITKTILISGIVQGVGFRPLVYHIANKYQIKGTVRNKGGVVEIIATSSEKNMKYFLYDLKIYPFGNHEITNMDVYECELHYFEDFKIIKSEEDAEVSIIPPDLPVCDECQKELLDKTNRRYGNPFISCMACGPRYTILDNLPYDRKNTTMQEYEMCADCMQEYEDPNNRRFHAQTISCNACGPYLVFSKKNAKGNESNLVCKENYKEVNERNLEQAGECIKNGGIIAVKGIGGYHFACSPYIEETVTHLRSLKGREEKPFAVMFDSLESIRECCFVSPSEQELLESKERPIVLLYKKENNMAYATDKGSVYCGAFLPYTPLQILLLKECGPLIMTSANISGKPIIKEDEMMLALNSSYLKGVLYNERRIVRSVDDSVTKIIDNKPQVIRRSRGYVPYPINVTNDEGKQVFAAGGDLKSAFCICYKNNAVVSQYFGDLEEIQIYEEYQKAYEDLSTLLKFSPDTVVCDYHPNYFSSKFAKTLGGNIIQVQHHHAHIASVMAEHDIKGKVIGVAFDGTGYGMDGNIWGGEFLVCENATFERAAHLTYTKMIGGDSSMKDAKKTATCYLLNAGLKEHLIEDDRKSIINAAIQNNVNTVLTSSMGRLFDAVASILGIGDQNSFEGECAMNLEKEAVLAIRNNKESTKLRFELQETNDMLLIDSNSLINDLIKYKQSIARDTLALGFHNAVVDMIVEVCNWIRKKQGIESVALSGGVFQNTLLVEESIKKLSEQGFQVFINRKVPPNDGSISLGQTFIGLVQ